MGNVGSDWYAPTVPWNHASTSRGMKVSGSWQIEAAMAGTYRFEVRRWPKEVERAHHWYSKVLENHRCLGLRSREADAHL